MTFYVRYLRLFWEEFYQSNDESDEEKEKWIEVSKKLTWKNQTIMFEKHYQMPLLDEVKKKASAWFGVTYGPWMKYAKKKQRDMNKRQTIPINNQEVQTQSRFNRLFSFAWLVYPVLLEIYNENKRIPTGNNKLKRKRTGTRKNDKSRRFS